MIAFPDAVEALAALGQPSRLALFRLLVRAGPDGLPAGSISAELGCLASTLSSHLAILSRTGLIAGRRERRSIVYAADYSRMRDLLGFLIEDCCDGRPEICGILGETRTCAS